jgi:hypothetical protein
MTVSTFNGVNRIITLASGIPPASGTNFTDAEAEMYSEWKRWAKLSDNAKFAPAFRTVGGDPLGAGVDAGAYFFLQNQARAVAEGGWIIKAPEQDGDFEVVGNVFGEDSTFPLFSGTGGTFTTQIRLTTSSLTQQVNVQEILAILDQSEVSNATFAGTVTIDTVNGKAGTDFPLGNTTNPVNNLADARVIADRLNLRSYTLESSLVLDSEHLDWRFVSGGFDHSLTLVSGVAATRGVFEFLIVNGDAGGNRINIQNSLIGNLERFTGNATDCAIGGPVTISPGIVVMGFCISSVAGFDPVDFTVLSPSTELNMRQYSGGFSLEGMQSADSKASIDLVSGDIILGATNTQGEIVVRGVGTLIDNTQPAVSVESTALMSTATTATAVWSESAATTVSGSFGEFVTSKLLTVSKFLGLK